MRRLLPLLAGLLLLATACTTGPDPDPKPDPNPSADRWRPKPGLAWQWQLSGRLDPTVDVPVYDIDGFDHPASTVRDLHARGRDRKSVV